MIDALNMHSLQIYNFTICKINCDHVCMIRWICHKFHWRVSSLALLIVLGLEKVLWAQTSYNKEHADISFATFWRHLGQINKFLLIQIKIMEKRGAVHLGKSAFNSVVTVYCHMDLTHITWVLQRCGLKWRCCSLQCNATCQATSLKHCKHSRGFYGVLLNISNPWFRNAKIDMFKSTFSTCLPISWFYFILPP